MQMIQKMIACCVSTMLGGALFPGSLAFAEGTAAKPAEVTIKGTCTFLGTKSNWSAKLTPTGTAGVYDAQYTAIWGGKQSMTYAGQMTTDLKTEVSGNGKATGGGGNGEFKFSGKFESDGVAKCQYSEIGGTRNRSGKLTVDSIEYAKSTPKPGIGATPSRIPNPKDNTTAPSVSPSVEPSPKRTYATAGEAQKAAVQRYPALAVAGSELNADFVARYNRYKQSNPDYFNDPAWPMRLAEETFLAAKSKQEK